MRRATVNERGIPLIISSCPCRERAGTYTATRASYKLPYYQGGANRRNKLAKEKGDLEGFIRDTATIRQP